MVALFCEALECKAIIEKRPPKNVKKIQSLATTHASQHSHMVEMELVDVILKEKSTIYRLVLQDITRPRIHHRFKKAGHFLDL